uniref:Uncharacterized protein n=1 Tax=Opuntia streptacantha TaxID=393608 RepID=A0A7C9CZQ7_OPUST
MDSKSSNTRGEQPPLSPLLSPSSRACCDSRTFPLEQAISTNQCKASSEVASRGRQVASPIGVFRLTDDDMAIIASAADLASSGSGSSSLSGCFAGSFTKGSSSLSMITGASKSMPVPLLMLALLSRKVPHGVSSSVMHELRSKWFLRVADSVCIFFSMITTSSKAASESMGSGSQGTFISKTTLFLLLSTSFFPD